MASRHGNICPNHLINQDIKNAVIDIINHSIGPLILGYESLITGVANGGRTRTKRTTISCAAATL